MGKDLWLLRQPIPAKEKSLLKSQIEYRIQNWLDNHNIYL